MSKMMTIKINNEPPIFHHAGNSYNLSCCDNTFEAAKQYTRRYIALSGLEVHTVEITLSDDLRQRLHDECIPDVDHNSGEI